jgi:uncharacterized protein
MDYWMITTGEESEPGIDGAIISKELGATVRTIIGVDSFDAYAKLIESKGGKVVTPTANIPGIGSLGGFQDTEGKMFVLIEPKMG